MMNVLIVGGGIGGLTTALCLAKRGIEVQVFEQAPEFGEVGAGLQVSPNSSRVLLSLGLRDALERVAFLPEGIEMRDWRSGRVLSSSPLGDAAEEKYGAPYYHVHRADLLAMLVEAACNDPSITLHTNSRIDHFEQHPASVVIVNHGERYEGDLLVGADGIHSSVREMLFGDSPPTFTGNVAWRGLVPAERASDLGIQPNATAWWGPGRHFVHYYVRAGDLVNCICVVEKEGWEVESWTESGDIGELQREFESWHPSVTRLISAMDPGACFKWALFDRPPLPAWSKGRVTLLGDACHPTLPFMAQGAAMAIEDAAVLAGRLRPEAIERSLAEYEGVRKPRTTSIQQGSRRNARVFHLSGLAAWARNRVVGSVEQRITNRLYSYDALAVGNNRLQDS
jgi:salicylate hydroxylase